MNMGGWIFAVICLCWAQDAEVDPPGSGLNEITRVTGAACDVVFPDLSNLEDAVRKHIEKMQQRLVEETARDPVDPKETAKLFGELGQVYHAHKYTAQAESCYLNALAWGGRSFQWLYLLGLLYQEMAHYDRAEETLMQASRLRDYGALWAHLGDIHLEQNALDQAEESYQKVLDYNSDEAAGWYGLGMVAFSRSNNERALECFARALELLPQADKIHYNLGMTYRKLRNREKAMEHLKLAGGVGVRPQDPIADELQDWLVGERVFLIRGKAAFAAGDIEAAVESFQQAMDAEPDSTRARVNLATALARLNRYPEAIAQLEKALELDESYQNAHYNLGTLLKELGQWNEAELHLREAVRLDSTDLDAWINWALTLEQLGQWDKARRACDTILAEIPDQETTALLLGRVLMAKSEFEQVDQFLRDYCERNPKSGRMAHFLARFLAACPDRSLRDGGRALELAVAVGRAMPTAQHLQTVAMAFAQSGLCHRAVELQHAAIKAAKASGEEDRLPALEAELRRYEAGAPCEPL